MFLRNWDNYKTYEVASVGVSLDVFPDKETYLKQYNGNYTAPPWQNDDYNYINWADTNNGYYKDNPTSTYFFIWPGGKVGDTYTRPQPGIDNKIIKYEDHNLYSPFYGGYQEESGVHIYAQRHIGSGYTYDKDNDTWSYTVTREFKNISGKEITIEEVGVFGWVQSLYAKEILDEPIIVQNDSYFKLSFTYKVDNPHENRKVNRIREIRYGGYTSDYRNETKLSPSKEKNIILITQTDYSTTNTASMFDTMGLTLKGWEKIQDSINIVSSNKYAIQINFLRPLKDSTENEIASASYYYSNSIYFHFYYCSDNLESFSLKSSIQISTTELKNSLEFSITPELNKSNRMYLMFREYPASVGIVQLDEDRCDFFYQYYQYQNLFLDTSNALSHTFKSSFNNYNLWCLVLDPVMKTDADGNEIPLYHDEPVK